MTDFEKTRTLEYFEAILDEFELDHVTVEFTDDDDMYAYVDTMKEDDGTLTHEIVMYDRTMESFLHELAHVHQEDRGTMNPEDCHDASFYAVFEYYKDMFR